MNWMKEKIYGNYAVVYHRTRIANIANSIYTEGFKPGDGAMYGKGFYATYELKSQQKRDMKKQYGSIILKAAVPINKFVFFDWDVFTKTPHAKSLGANENNFIQLQCEQLGVRPHSSKFTWPTDAASRDYTSDTALYVLKRTNLRYCAAGIVFTGRRDGHVLVAYQTDIVIPLAIQQRKWEPFIKVPFDQAYLARMLKAKLTPTTPQAGVPDWFAKAKKRNVKFTVDLRGVKWKWGIWDDGDWMDGTWYNGRWNGGTWHGGDWYNGVWNGGTWHRGDWMQGTWRGGEWKKGWFTDGIWERGHWLGGAWENGTWYGGVWEDGIWYDGVWKDGLWKGGHWESGTWFAGTWEMGHWKFGKWYGGVWKNGLWTSGWIYDPYKRGNYRTDAQWDKSNTFVLSSINPAEYWRGVR